MKNPILWLCVFVALAGAAAFLYLNLGSDAEELTPNESTPLQDDQTEETGAARRHLPKLFEKPLKDEAPAPGSKSTAVDLQNTRLVLLRVLDAESERPLEGIGIFVADETPEMRTRAEAFIKEHPELARDRRAMMKALCERFETGSQGEILARLSNRRLTFLVDDARYAGNARLKSAEGTDAEAAPTDSQTTATLVISVTLKKNFYAKVLDAQGQPLSGFHLKLLPSSQRSSFGGQSTPTDRTGLAKIEIAPKFGQPHSQGNAEKYSWHVMGLFRKNLAIEAEESTTSEQPQIIQLPELGWIDLSLVLEQASIFTLGA